MKSDKGIKVIAIVALCLALVGLGVGYAAFSASLSIKGTGTVNASSWKIKFQNLSTATLVGEAKEVKAPTINTNDTNISDYSATFTAPGDSISYTFEVANTGTFDAAVSTIAIPTPTCTGNGVNAATDASNVCKNLSYSLTYTDGTAIAVGDTLTKGETKALKLTLVYKNSITAGELPTDDVSISNLETSILFSQD